MWHEESCFFDVSGQYIRRFEPDCGAFDTSTILARKIFATEIIDCRFSSFTLSLIIISSRQIFDVKMYDEEGQLMDYDFS